MKYGKPAGGFTLIELIAVTVIIGVLATATTQYITFGTQVYIQSSERQQVLSQSRFLVERLTREIRTAVPNSVRVSNNNACIEFTPIKASGAYRTDASAILPPISPNSSSGQIEVISWDRNNERYVAGDRMYIYATSDADIYKPTNEENDNFAIIDSVAGTSPNLTINLEQIGTDDDVFQDESPITRYFTADHSVNYCFIANSGKYDVYRFELSNFAEAQVAPSTSVSVLLLGGVLMVEGLTNNIALEAPFEYTQIAQTKNSVVSLYLEFEANQSENMFYNQEVHIPNVP
jgi:MSHA biogenesis protein MshO